MTSGPGQTFMAARWVDDLLSPRSDRPLLVYQGKKVSASAMAEEVSAVRANLASSGVMADGIVAVACERTPGCVAVILACLAEGVAPFLVDPRQDFDLLCKLMDALRVQGVFGGSALDSSAVRSRLPYLKWSGETGPANTVRRPAATDATTEGGFLLHSAGTCALPRVYHHSGAAIGWQAQSLIQALRLKSGAELWFTGNLAQSPAFALGLCAVLSAGGMLVLDDPAEFLPKVTRKLDSQRILLLCQASDRQAWNAEKLLGVKAKISAVMITDFDLSEEYAQMLANATDAAVWCGYSATEAAGFLTVNSVPGVWPAESVGRPIGGAELLVHDLEDQRASADRLGRILYNGAPSPVRVVSLTFQAKGEPVRTVQATGDWGRIDANDFIYLAGCDRSVFSRGGFLVEAKAVEDGLRGLDGIAEAFVYGVPADEVEHEVNAAILPRAGSIDLNQVAAHLTDKLPRFMHPERAATVPALPYTPTGKLKRIPGTSAPKNTPKNAEPEGRNPAAEQQGAAE